MKTSSRIKIILAVASLWGASRCLAATITATPGDSLQAKIDAAANGTLVIGAGTFNVAMPLNVHAGTTILGAPNFGSHIVFNLQANDLTYYGFLLDANASNVTIKGLDIVSNHGIVGMYSGSGFTNITITGNQLQYGGGSTSNGTQVEGIFEPVGNTNNLQITYNYFHDSPATNRNWEIWGCSNSNLDHNLFQNINDGGHFLNVGTNDSFSFNYGSNLHRMGQEIQQALAGSNGLIVTGNVFYDWVNPYYDSFGLSVCPATTNVVVSNNYVRTSLAAGSGWGPPDGDGVSRFGYMIECMSPSLQATGNTLVAVQKTYAGFGAGMATVVSGNDAWGAASTMFGIMGGDKGPGGIPGTYVQGPIANATSAGLTGAPNPPANTFAGPQFANGSAPPATTSASIPTATNTLANLAATPTNNGVLLAWTSPISNISIHTYTPEDDCGTITLAGPATSVTLTNLNPGWAYSTTISGTQSGTNASATINFQTGGTSPPGTAATQAQLASQATPVHTILTFPDGSISVDGTK